MIGLRTEDMKSFLDRHPYRSALVINAAAILVVFLVRGIVFETVDDYNVMMTLSGEKTGGPYFQVTFFNSVFAFLITRLYLLYGGVQWYSLLHIVTIWLALSAILGTVLSQTKLMNQPKKLVLTLFALYYLSVYCYPVQRLQFTSTSALCGAAACALLFSVTRETLEDEEKTRNAVVCSALFLAMSLIWRRSAGIASGAICCVAAARLIIVCWQAKYRPRMAFFLKTLASCIVIAGVTLAFILGHFYIMDHGDNAGYREYDQWRGDFQDHPQLTYEEAPELYESIGWSELEYHLFKSLIYIDDGINAESFQTIVEASDEARGPISVYDTLKLAKSILWDNKYGRGVTLILFFMAALLFVDLLFVLRKHGPLATEIKFNSLCAIALVGATFFLTYYVCSTGRWSVRTYESVSLPVTGALLISFIRCDVMLREIAVGRSAETKKDGSMQITVLAFASVALLTVTAAASVRYLETLREKDDFSLPQMASIEAYAMSHPDSLFIHDYSVSNTYNSYDPFRVHTDGDLHNLVISGGSYTFTGAYYAQLERNGLTELTGETLLQDGVYYISNPKRGGPYYVTVARYLEEKYCTSYRETVVEDDIIQLDGDAHVYQFRFADRPTPKALLDDGFVRLK